MALFDETLTNEICSQAARHHVTLGAALGHTISTDEARTDLVSPLAKSVNLLIHIANGQQSRTGSSKTDVAHVEAALLQVQEALFGNAMQTRAIMPDNFWQSNIGILFSRVRWWISADELITISNAAALAFGDNTQANRMRIVRAIDNGMLDWIPDPSVANPQQNKRVLRPQVERLAEQRSRPE